MKSDADLLAECTIQSYRSSGPGGQNVNTTDSAVRLIHHPTGIVVTSQEARSQLQNRQRCLQKLRKKIAALYYKPPKRLATKKPRGAKERVLKAKAQRSAQKKLRGKLFDRSD